MNPNALEEWFPNGAPRLFELSRSHRIDLDSANAARELLIGRRGPGWVCTTDQVVRVSGEASDIPGSIPLCAEIMLDERSSLHLRQSRHGWSAWVLEDREGEGAELAFDATFLSTVPSSGVSGRGNPDEATAPTARPPKLRYRTYFRKEPAESQDEATRIAVWQPFAFRFLGWEET